MSETETGNTLYDWLGGEIGFEAHRIAIDDTILELLETDK